MPLSLPPVKKRTKLVVRLVARRVPVRVRAEKPRFPVVVSVEVRTRLLMPVTASVLALVAEPLPPKMGPYCWRTRVRFSAAR